MTVMHRVNRCTSQTAPLVMERHLAGEKAWRLRSYTGITSRVITLMLPSTEPLNRVLQHITGNLATCRPYLTYRRMKLLKSYNSSERYSELTTYSDSHEFIFGKELVCQLLVADDLATDRRVRLDNSEIRLE